MIGRRWKLTRSTAAVVIGSIVTLLSWLALPATATWTSSGVLVDRAALYDYAPTVIYDSGVYRYWWLGEHSTGNDVDNIYYQTYTVSTNTWSAATQITLGVGGTGWDSVGIGDPSVVKGSFTIGGGTHTYLMYFNAPDKTYSPYGSSIGVAYSDNGSSWTEYASNPIITCQHACTIGANASYGAGQPSAYNSGGTNVTLIYVDSSTNGSGSQGTTPRLFKATSTNGITFSAPTIVSQTGLKAQNWQMQSDVAYDAASSKWYMVTFNRKRGVSEGIPGIEIQDGVYTIPNANLGSGTWTSIGVVDQNLTGFGQNHNSGFLRNTDGTINLGSSIINLYTTVGTNDPTSADNTSDTFGLNVATLNTTKNTLPLYRYEGTHDLATISCTDDLDSDDDASCVGHAIPTGQGYTENAGPSTFGYVLRSPVAGTVELLSCSYQNGTYNDYYLSALPTGGTVGGSSYMDSAFAAQTCDASTSNPAGNTSTTFIGTAGWIYTSSGTGRIAIYSCYSPVIGHWDLYTSTDLHCETTGHDGNLLGYTSSTA